MSTLALLAKASQATATGGDLVAAGVNSSQEARLKYAALVSKQTRTKKQIQSQTLTPTPAPTARGSSPYIRRHFPKLKQPILKTKEEIKRITPILIHRPIQKKQPSLPPRTPLIKQIIPRPIFINIAPQKQSQSTSTAPKTTAASAPKITSTAAPAPKASIATSIPVKKETSGQLSFFDNIKNNVKKYPMLYIGGGILLLILIIK